LRASDRVASGRCRPEAPTDPSAEAPARGLSALNSMAFGLAVYASRCGSPTPHARLVSGRWLGATGRAFHPQGSTERFQSSLLHLIPFPKLLAAIGSTDTSANLAARVGRIGRGMSDQSAQDVVSVRVLSVTTAAGRWKLLRVSVRVIDRLPFRLGGRVKFRIGRWQPHGRVSPLIPGLVLVLGRRLWDYPGPVRDPTWAGSTAAGSLARVRVAGARIGDTAPCIY
jgi:hypothetical protein